MSYGPFLGGRRICLGKTFAENIGKCILAMIFMQFDFEFKDPKLYSYKAPNSFAHSEMPHYDMIVKKQTDLTSKKE